jgi:hypothetical protein
MNSRGIELSLNFIVMLILSIVVFGFGLLFLRNLTNAAHDQIGNIPSEEKYQLQACLNEGNTVCVVTTRKEIRTGKSDIVGMSLVNKRGDGDFLVYNEFSKGIDETGVDIPAGANRVESGVSPKTYTIKNYEEQNVILPYGVPNGVKRGEYIFNVFVCVDLGSVNPTPARDPCYAINPNYQVYGGLHKVYIDVV